MRTRQVKPRLRGGKIDELNPQQRLFVTELLADRTFNASKAAEKAGYAQPATAGGKLLNVPTIRAIVGHQMLLREQRTLITADKVVVELGKLAFADTTQLFNKNGTLKPLHELPPELASSIESVKVRTKVSKSKQVTTITEYKLHSKVASLDLLMRHLGLLKDQKIQVEGNVTIDFGDLLKQAKTANNVIDAETIQMKAIEHHDAAK